MKTGETYYNSMREEQIVELMEVNGVTVVYKVLQGNFNNALKIFKCTKKRFNNLYIKTK